MNGRLDLFNADNFATFWMLPKDFEHSLVLQMSFIH